jgi:hypothetical protein
MSTAAEAALDRIRGEVAPRNHNARTISALTSNPGCNRRAIMDAAGIDKSRLASHVGFPFQFGQSQFAITRGNVFEAQVKADGCAELLTLLRDKLGLDLPEVAYDDLELVGGNTSREVRHSRTKNLLTRAATGSEDAGTLFDHPLLRLSVAGREVYLEPDLIAFQWKGQFHVVEIKSFPVIDGQADGGHVAAAVIQSAVYVYAMRTLLSEHGLPTDAVADNVVLVCPKDFSNRPTATLVDVRKQLTVLCRQLSRLTRIEALLSLLPPTLSLSEARPPAAVAADLRLIEARYMPECLNNCELARFCRDESRGCTRVMGRTVSEDLGGVETVYTALGLARCVLPPSPEQEEAASLLRLAWAMRQECLGSVA